MPTVDLTFRRPHVNQRIILDSPARFRVAACGRRFGKTEVGKIAISLKALAGEPCWWVAPTYKTAMDVWRDLRATFRPMYMAEVIASEHTILLPHGGMIAVRSVHEYQNLRGKGLGFVVLDEAAFMHPDVWPEVIRPMLLERRGGALFLSSPRGRNHFWQLYGYGLDPLEPDWAAFHFTAYDNPLVSPDELAAIQRTTPDRLYRQEYLAEFIDDAGAVFRGVKEAATAPKNAAPVAGHRYLMGVDWARENDFTAIAVIDADTSRMVALDRFNQIGWELQRKRLEGLYKRWKPQVIWAEANSIGGPNIEALQASGLPVRAFTTTAQSKGPLIETLALAIERKDIALLPDEVLMNELIAYQLDRLPGGGYRYSAPEGGHDDTVIATALAWHGAVAGGRVRLVEFA